MSQSSFHSENFLELRLQSYSHSIEEPGTKASAATACHNLDKTKWADVIESNSIEGAGVFIAISSGFGEQGKGKLAASNVISSVKEYISSRNTWPEEDTDKLMLLKKCILFAHKTLKGAVEDEPDLKGIAASCLLAWLFEDKLLISWCGADRAYLERDETLLQLSEDHTVAAHKVKKGEMELEKALKLPKANCLTQCIGDTANKPDPDALIFDLTIDDRLIFLSNSLAEELNPAQLLRLSETSNSPAGLCSSIANDTKREDYPYSLTVVDIVDGPEIEAVTNEFIIKGNKKVAKEKKLNPFWFFGIIAILAGVIFILLPKNEPGPEEASKPVTISDAKSDSLLMEDSIQEEEVPVEEIELSPEQREVLLMVDSALIFTDVNDLFLRVDQCLKEKKDADAYLLTELRKYKRELGPVEQILAAAQLKGAPTETEINDLKVLVSRYQSGAKSALDILKLLEDPNNSDLE